MENIYDAITVLADTLMEALPIDSYKPRILQSAQNVSPSLTGLSLTSF
jgi:hypothetical protein